MINCETNSLDICLKTAVDKWISFQHWIYQCKINWVKLSFVEEKNYNILNLHNKYNSVFGQYNKSFFLSNKIIIWKLLQ